ncbi:MAG: SGNH/GDSL hydrolase family protein [Saprospiraceae bacterium]
MPPVTNPPHIERIDILALGDSYTKGQGVAWAKNFPNQLADALKSEKYDVAGVHIIAQTGWRTDQLKSAIASQTNVIGDSTFSLVTLCIGVNNQYQNADFETYKKEFEQLLQTAIERAGDRADRVFVLSIPDWAFTTYGQNYGDPATTSQEIDQYNAANYEIAKSYEVNYVQVTDISRQGLVRPEFVADDGLHPSALQYTEWLKIMMPQVQDVLKK